MKKVSKTEGETLVVTPKNLKRVISKTKKALKVSDEVELKASKPNKPGKAGAYTMKLKLADKEYTSTSDDLKEAIMGLKVEKYTSKGFFTLEHDGKSATVVSIIPRMKRIIKNEMTAYFFGRRLIQILKPVTKE